MNRNWFRKRKKQIWFLSRKNQMRFFLRKNKWMMNSLILFSVKQVMRWHCRMNVLPQAPRRRCGWRQRRQMVFRQKSKSLSKRQVERIQIRLIPINYTCQVMLIWITASFPGMEAWMQRSMDKPMQVAPVQSRRKIQQRHILLKMERRQLLPLTS